MSISIVIPTYNGANRIHKLLKSIESQTQLPDETIFVVDGSTDSTLDILNNWNTLPGLKVVKQLNQGRAGARNSGATIATGDLLIFYDDDMELNPDSIEIHCRSDWGSRIIAGQQIEIIEEENEFSKFKSYLSQKWVSHFCQNSPQVLNEQELFLTAANMAISKKNFELLGGFDSELTDAEDFDLAVRGFEKGIKTVFHPKNIAFHKSFTSFRSYIIRQRQYRKAHHVLNQIRQGNPNIDLYKKYIVNKSRLKNIMYKLFPKQIVFWIDKGYFNILPKSIKYPIYSRVISAFSIYRAESQL